MLKMIDVHEALSVVLENAPLLQPLTVPVSQCCGRVLAEDVVSDKDYPPFNRAMMDGFAVRLVDAGRLTPISGEVAAGSDSQVVLSDGECVEIMTGAPCPVGTESVVQVEHTEQRGDQVLLPADVALGRHITPQGSDCSEGGVVARAGDVITPLVVANLATFGATQVRVSPSPSLAIITTGAELSQPGERPAQAQIRDSNGPMLCGLARLEGITELTMLHATDTPESIAQSIEQAADAQIVVFTGGVSASRYDLVPQAIADFGAEIVFHKVKQKPGKPLLFARKGDRLFFGLPGSPLGCLLGFHRYVSAAIRSMSGRRVDNLRMRGRLTRSITVRLTRAGFLLARANVEADSVLLEPVGGSGASDIFAAARANAYIELPIGSHDIAAGTEVEFEFIGMRV